ncbi:hypothetical protein HanRHA438_Chr12g0553581 [Helianthus annuus]|uniref:Uncharacterized protein n=1 Tax=Helianthus annuus TaxID=4232 RepID=A0A251T2V0_HELAN|nr:hypothetical protein HanXRQr2_Chr12g0542431 [Helianthus annuus]KAJ0620691.1 hypothetical protein HanIR_Chr01g0000351 [Helianthus annuus]KAJ0862779.1 hypothetical protein HanPSC8_Chr12g0522241 [Helianthus annuus]KAJ0866596.1 hypothetical protein HanRHA438_Chr12g0553581 [Helianthus annuus]
MNALKERQRESLWQSVREREGERRRKGRAGQSTVVSHAGSWPETVAVVSFTPMSGITLYPPQQASTLQMPDKTPAVARSPLHRQRCRN